ncbi:hypothetical protein RGQ29_022942 [Quercus rubra]|uniref:Nodulation signaling pathway 2-like protein n=1 Tax=Quercus rubra TaxID=3512 RepID=A0AAN7F5X7_QUERU|nr:hypothetical protein RGQ29_022942 [Quercus rubra]
MNAMENEQFWYTFSPIYNDEVLACSLENSFSFETRDSFSPNSIPDGLLDYECMERFLQIESGVDLEIVDSICQDAAMEDIVVESEVGSENIRETKETVGVLIEGNSNLKVVQEELMEDSSLTDLLLMGAESVEAQNRPLASTIFTKLNNLLFVREKRGDNIFDRLARFFTQGLHYKTIDTLVMQHEPLSRQSSSISAIQMLQELSPYLKFAHFMANQAILEATQGDSEVHVIDFDIMEGIQWPPLMVDLSRRKDASLRVTAIIADERNADIKHQTGRRLKEFADSNNFPFAYNLMIMVKEEDFERIEVGPTLIANCMMHQTSIRSFSLVNTFLGGVGKLSPKIVVLVEEELFNLTRISSMSFVEFFCEALHHYASLYESLASSLCGEYKSGLRLIEKEFLGIRILDSLSQFPCEEERMSWENDFASLKGFKAISMSFYNVSQAKFLVSLLSGGYWAKFAKQNIFRKKLDGWHAFKIN